MGYFCGMIGALWILLAIVLLSSMGKPPSHVHDPRGYDRHQGCRTIYIVILLVGIGLLFLGGCLSVLTPK
jgi:hypothetical protein